MKNYQWKSTKKVFLWWFLDDQWPKRSCALDYHIAFEPIETQSNEIMYSFWKQWKKDERKKNATFDTIILWLELWSSKRMCMWSKRARFAFQYFAIRKKIYNSIVFRIEYFDCKILMPLLSRLEMTYFRRLRDDILPCNVKIRLNVWHRGIWHRFGEPQFDTLTIRLWFFFIMCCVLKLTFFELAIFLASQLHIHEIEIVATKQL